MSLHQLSVFSVVLVAALTGCGRGKNAAQLAEAKKAQETEINDRARSIAGELTREASELDAKRQAAAAQHARDTRRAEWQRVVDHPEQVLEAANVQTTAGGALRLVSVSVTNKSKYAVTDVRGTVDFHGGDSDDDVMARVPVKLSGSIGPGASMVFSERQHTLSGAAIKLAKAPSAATFTVVSVTSVDPGGLEPVATSNTDGGAAAQP